VKQRARVSSAGRTTGPLTCAIVESAEPPTGIAGDVSCEMFTRLHAEVGAKTDGFARQLKFCFG